MKKTCFHTLLLVFTGILFFHSPLSAQDDTKPWERLGLSITEWKLIQDNKLPMTKVEELLKDGIGISEYFKKPWESLDLTEEKWIALRKSGLTNDDIEHTHRVAATPVEKNTPGEGNTFTDYDDSKETTELLKSFLAPGVLQYRCGRKTEGRIMIGLAATSVVGCAAFSIVKKQFIPLPLLVILVPDMCWSLHDHKKYLAAARP